MNVAARSLVFRPSIQRDCMPSCPVSGRKTAVAIRFCSAFSSAREPTSSRGVFNILDELIGLERFMMDFFKTWNAVVPFKQCGGATNEFHRVGVEFPDGIKHRMIVGIENILLELRMPCDVDLSDTIVRDIINVGVWIEIVILR